LPLRRYPSQTRLRSGGTVPRPENSGSETENPLATAAKETRVPHVDGRDPARRDAGQRLAWLPAGEQGGLAGTHHRSTVCARLARHRIDRGLPGYKTDG